MKKLLFIVTIIAIFFSVGVSAEEKMSSWAENYVKRAYDVNILNDEMFSGDLTAFITREEYAEIVLNVMNACGLKWEDVKENPFKDTKSQAVVTLYGQEIIYGKDKDRFAPKDFLTREEGAEILFRVYKKLYPNEKLDHNTAFFEYSDDEKISAWAHTGVYFMAWKEIMQGTGDNMFSPVDTYTKEEAITSVVRLYEYYIAQDNTQTFADILNNEMSFSANYMFSPLSIKMALALAANGAEGVTKDEIIKALGISDLEKFNEFSKDLILKYSQTENLKLNIANSIWINKDKTDLKFSDGFKNIANEYYFAESNTVDDENAVNEINSWVSKKTNEKIPSIIEDNDFWAAIVNAVYFKGLWQKEFYEFGTSKDEFTSLGGKASKIDFMNDRRWCSYAETLNSKIVELPFKTSFEQFSEEGEFSGFEKYDNLDVSMYLILPDKSISPEKELNNAISDEMFNNTYIDLSVPKFKFEFSTGLNEILKNIGIKEAFTENADFNKMFDNGSMWFTNTIHKTYISVDEKGTEAAAVTSIAMAGSSLPPEPVVLKFNKPFYFIIRDNTSGEALFMGRFADAD